MPLLESTEASPRPGVIAKQLDVALIRNAYTRRPNAYLSDPPQTVCTSQKTPQGSKTHQPAALKTASQPLLPCFTPNSPTGDTALDSNYSPARKLSANFSSPQPTGVTEIQRTVNEIEAPSKSLNCMEPRRLLSNTVSEGSKMLHTFPLRSQPLHRENEHSTQRRPPTKMTSKPTHLEQDSSSFLNRYTLETLQPLCSTPSNSSGTSSVEFPLFPQVSHRWNDVSENLQSGGVQRDMHSSIGVSPPQNSATEIPRDNFDLLRAETRSPKLPSYRLSPRGNYQVNNLSAMTAAASPRHSLIPNAEDFRSAPDEALPMNSARRLSASPMSPTKFPYNSEPSNHLSPNASATHPHAPATPEKQPPSPTSKPPANATVLLSSSQEEALPRRLSVPPFCNSSQPNIDSDHVKTPKSRNRRFSKLKTQNDPRVLSDSKELTPDQAVINQPHQRVRSPKSKHREQHNPQTTETAVTRVSGRRGSNGKSESAVRLTPYRATASPTSPKYERSANRRSEKKGYYYSPPSPHHVLQLDIPSSPGAKTTAFHPEVRDRSRFYETQLELYFGFIGIQIMLVFANFVFANPVGALVLLFGCLSACYSHIDRRSSGYVLTAVILLISAIVIWISVLTDVNGFLSYKNDPTLNVIAIGSIPLHFLFLIHNVSLAWQHRSNGSARPLSGSTTPRKR